MFRKRKIVESIGSDRENKILNWLKVQLEKPTFHAWDETTIKVLCKWQHDDKFGNKINILAQTLYLKFFLEVCKLRCIQKYGKVKGNKILKEKQDKLREIEKYCEDNKFIVDNI